MLTKDGAFNAVECLRTAAEGMEREGITAEVMLLYRPDKMQVSADIEVCGTKYNLGFEMTHDTLNDCPAAGLTHFGNKMVEVAKREKPRIEAALNGEHTEQNGGAD